MHILLVEDDAEVRGGLSAFLQSRGFHVEAVAADAAVEPIAGSPDVLISGYRMKPLQVERLIESRNDLAPDVPVIVLVTASWSGDEAPEVEVIDTRHGVGRLLIRLQELEADLAALDRPE